jgi:serine/threonine-protein phosphatase PGAM5
MKTWTLAFALLMTFLAPVRAVGQGAGGVHYVYLVRHGIYDRDTTVTDDRLGNGLNTLGHEQAKLAGARLAQLPVRLHALVTSDYARARETADDIGALLNMVPVQDSLLHECTPPSDRPDLMKDPADLALCSANLEAAWAKYFSPSPDADRHDVLVCHGNVIRWMTARALGLDLKRWIHMDIGNCSLTVLAVRPDGSVRLVMYSDVGHIPVSKQTWAGAGAGWKAK